MPLPKSVVKIKAKGVEYTSNVDMAQYLITELERAALRDIGKVLRYRIKAEIPKDKGDAKKSLATWVRKQDGDKAAKLQIGYYNKRTAGKKGLKYVGFYTHILEFGSVKQKGRRPLARTVQGNTDEIRKIVAAYLGELSKDEKTIALKINGEEEVSDE